MRIRPVALAVAASAMLFAAGARAQDLQPRSVRDRAAGSRPLAAVGNIVFMPVRVALTVVNAGLGGPTGMADRRQRPCRRTACSVCTNGQGFLQPDMMVGREPLEVGEYRYNCTSRSRKRRPRRERHAPQLAAPPPLAKGRAWRRPPTSRSSAPA